MIRLATEQDLPLVGSIYEEILAEEEKRPASFTNWQRGKYPTVEHARAALEAGTLYVAEEDGEVYGCVNLNGEQLAEYAALNWSVPADPEDVMVIHTLCISPRWAGRGKAREFVAFCEEEARRKGKKVMRLDTYEGNLPANTMYPKLGYTFVGGTEFFFQEPRPPQLRRAQFISGTDTGRAGRGGGARRRPRAPSARRKRSAESRTRRCEGITGCQKVPEGLFDRVN